MILNHTKGLGIPRRLSHLLWWEIVAFVHLLYDPCYSYYYHICTVRSPAFPTGCPVLGLAHAWCYKPRSWFRRYCIPCSTGHTPKKWDKCHSYLNCIIPWAQGLNFLSKHFKPCGLLAKALIKLTWGTQDIKGSQIYWVWLHGLTSGYWTGMQQLFLEATWRVSQGACLN